MILKNYVRLCLYTEVTGKPLKIVTGSSLQIGSYHWLKKEDNIFSKSYQMTDWLINTS